MIEFSLHLKLWLRHLFGICLVSKLDLCPIHPLVSVCRLRSNYLFLLPIPLSSPSHPLFLSSSQGFSLRGSCKSSSCSHLLSPVKCHNDILSKGEYSYAITSNGKVMVCRLLFFTYMAIQGEGTRFAFWPYTDSIRSKHHK